MDRRSVILVTLVQWILVVVLVSQVRSRMKFFLIAAVAGSGLGAIQSASRVFMARLAALSILAFFVAGGLLLLGVPAGGPGTAESSTADV